MSERKRLAREAIADAVAGRCRWWCEHCWRVLVATEGPSEHSKENPGHPVFRVEPAPVDGATIWPGLPPGHYWLSTAKSPNGDPVMVHGPVTPELVN